MLNDSNYSNLSIDSLISTSVHLMYFFLFLNILFQIEGLLPGEKYGLVVNCNNKTDGDKYEGNIFTLPEKPKLANDIHFLDSTNSTIQVKLPKIKNEDGANT